MWQLGEVERARELIDSANRRASELGHVRSIADALFWKSYLEMLAWRPRRDAERGRGSGARRARTRHGAVRSTRPNCILVGRGVGSMTARPARPSSTGSGGFRRSGRQGQRWGSTADCSRSSRRKRWDADSALARIDEALRSRTQVEHRCSLPFLHRLRGEILLKRDPADPAPAEEAFQTAIAIAKEQGARSFELRASLSLAKLYQSTGRPADAHAVLAPALEGFSPTPEMPEIAEAQALLAALSETDEVKAEAAQRQRLTQLHVAYGNALIAARGYGAPETTEAFARARELASGDKDAPERLAADFGLWVGSYARGELAVDAGARGGLPQRRRGETRFARGRRRASRRRDHLLVRRRVSRGAGSSWNARSPCSNPAATTIWPFASDWTPASPRWPIWRLRRGLSARSIARFRSSTACRRGSRTSPMSARSRSEECTRPCSN